MSKVSSKVEKVTGSIAAIRTLLENYPELQVASFTPLTALDMLLEICRLCGLDVMAILGWVSEMLCGVQMLADKAATATANKFTEDTVDKTTFTQGFLDHVEYAIKTILFLNFQQAFGCSINPFLPDRLMLSPNKDTTKYNAISNNEPNGGMVLNIDGIDLFGVLDMNPLDERGGSSFYFDTTHSYWRGDSDISYSANELWKSFDFNAYLWYLINKSSFIETNDRKKCVWDNRFKYRETFFNDNNKGDAFFNEPIIEHYKNCAEALASVTEENTVIYADFDDDENTENGQPSGYYRLENGKLVQYTNDTVKSPIVVGKYSPAEIRNYNADALIFWISAENYYRKRTIFKKVQDKGVRLNVEALPKKNENPQKGDSYYVDTKGEYYIYTGKDKEENGVTTPIYIPCKILYLNKTIYEFNYDFIFNMKLFDSKVITANIIKSILGMAIGSVVGMKFNIAKTAVQGKIGEILKDIMTMDGQEIDDSSYTFSNENYDTQLQKSVKQQQNIYNTVNGEKQYTEEETEDILNKINNIDNAATLDEQKQAITTAISTATAIAAENGAIEEDINIDLSSVNIIKKVVTELAVQITMQILSPKMMVLFAVNSYVMNGDAIKTDGGKIVIPTWDAMMNDWSNLIKNVVKEIFDLLIKMLYNWVMEQILPLIKLFIERLALETIRYYKELIENLLLNCIPSLTFNSESAQSVIDNVNYADIIPEQKEPKTVVS